MEKEQDSFLEKDIALAQEKIVAVLKQHNLDLVAFINYDKAAITPGVAFARPMQQEQPSQNTEPKQQGDFVSTRTDEQIAVDEVQQDVPLDELN